MRLCATAVFLVLLSMVPGARAQDDELQPTTEFGVTIVADQIYDAIQETQDFWSPVRHQILNETYVGADSATRKEAAEFFKRVNDQLHDRMFGGDEAQAMDLIDFLSTRLRVFGFYRELRSTIGNDVSFVALKLSWDKGLREANTLSSLDRTAAIDALVKQLESEMHSVGVEPAKVERAVAIWQTLGKATGRLNETRAGQMMLAFEHEAKARETQVGTLIRSVADTADWALITRPEKKLLKGSDFARAWQDLEKIRGPKTAQNPTAAVGK